MYIIYREYPPIPQLLKYIVSILCQQTQSQYSKYWEQSMLLDPQLNNQLQDQHHPQYQFQPHPQSPSTLTSARVWRFQTDQISLAKLSEILSLLRNMRIQGVKAKFNCSDPEILSQLENSLYRRLNTNLLAGSTKQTIFFQSLGKQDLPIDQIKNKRYKKTIDLNNWNVMQIFINQFRSQLRDLGEQFKLYMISEGSMIRVHSDYQISSIFQSQIVNMKHTLKWIIFPDQQFYKKLRYSKYMVERLQQKGIKSLCTLKTKSVILHSSTVRPDEIKNAKNQFAYEALVLQFHNEVCSISVNRIYFRMLMYHCQPFLNKISDNYEIRSEVSWKRRGIILHTKDQIFSQQPKQELKTFLANIIFVAYYTRKPMEHIEYIRDNKPRTKCLQVMMSDIFVYTSWNTTKTIDPIEVVRVFGKLFDELSEKTCLKVSFRTGGLVKGVLDRVVDLASKYRLFCEPLQVQDKKAEIINIKFKSFYNKPAKVKQISQFLQQLMTGKVGMNQIEHQQQESIVSNQQSLFQESLIVEVGSPNREKHQFVVSQQQKIQVVNKGLFSCKFELPSITKFTPTQAQHSISNTIKKGKPNRNLQTIFVEKFGIQCKIWNIIYNDSAKLQVQQFIQFQGEQCELRLTSKPKINQDGTICLAQQCKLDEVMNEQVYYLVSNFSNSTVGLITHEICIYSQ